MFLGIIADWIESRAKLKRNGLACSVLRGSASNKVWGGVGVYTVSEIFFDAGKFIN
jgi:hypothetical protein